MYTTKGGNDVVYRCAQFGQSTPIGPHTLFVVALFEGEGELWVVGAFGDVDEVKRVYKDWYEQDVVTHVLFGSQTPLWVVCSEHFPNDKDFEGDSNSMATGPFFAASLSQDYLQKMREEDKSFIGGEALALLKP